MTCLEHRIDKEGLHPTEAKTKAILQAPAPKNLTELQAFLGLLNYYGKFLPNLSTVLAPLHKLLMNHTKWIRRAEQAKAFQEAKDLLQSPRVLVHYDSLSFHVMPHPMAWKPFYRILWTAIQRDQ